MKYKTRLLLLLLFFVYGFVVSVFYIHYRAQQAFKEKPKAQQWLPWRPNSRKSADKLDRVLRLKKSLNHFTQNTEENVLASKGGLKTCREKQNFVFIKCMKCATETLETILRRFGLTRNLNFVLPIEKRLYLGWPYPIEPGDYKPPRKSPLCPQCRTGYNILTEHAIYNRTFMRHLMPSDTVFITIIREPYKHLISTFRYFKLQKLLNITQPDAVGEYLTNYRMYESIYKSSAISEKRYCIPNNFSLTENLLSHCLGMPLGFPNGRISIGADPEAIVEYIKMLDQDFSLVMLVEYFHESLILLRRMMCWTFKDIIYMKVNVGRKNTLPKTSREIQKWQDQLYWTYSSVDYVLYEYFNRTFWEKIARQRDGFFEEVKHFKNVHKDVTEFCYSFKMNFRSNQTLFVPSSRWDAGFNFTTFDCNFLSHYLLSYLHEQYYEHMKGFYKDTKTKSSRTFC